MTQLAEPLHVIDVRTVASPQRHPLIFSTFDSLPLGAALVLVNDHDPVPLNRQFESTRPGKFRWDYLEAGPALWRVRVTQLGFGGEPAGAGSSCCGSCSCR